MGLTAGRTIDYDILQTDDRQTDRATEKCVPVGRIICAARAIPPKGLATRCHLPCGITYFYFIISLLYVSCICYVSHCNSEQSQVWEVHVSSQEGTTAVQNRFKTSLECSNGTSCQK